MSEKTIKKSIFSRIRNYFIAGIVVLIPIGIKTTIPAIKLFLNFENTDFLILIFVIDYE